MNGSLTAEEHGALDRWWRAANYLSVGQIYLLDNPLLAEPLQPRHIKPRLLGHWGTTPGLNFIYAHLNRVIRRDNQAMMFICGPGHGGPAMVANAWLDGTYSQIYPKVGQDAAGMTQLFRQFSFPGGVPSHAAPETPGSINEGGELGYSLSHAYGAAFDNPNLVVVCVVGDGEAETGALATAWHSNKFLNPDSDGAVLPILHLNGYKIANPTLLARIGHDELHKLLEGFGYHPIFVAANDQNDAHVEMAKAIDTAFTLIKEAQRSGRNGNGTVRPQWPLIVLDSPKGWTGPREVDGLAVEGTWRAHQVPLTNVREDPKHLAQLQEWLLSYEPVALFDSDGKPFPETVALAPAGDVRMSATPHANGGLLLRDLQLPKVSDYASALHRSTVNGVSPMHVLGTYLRDVMVQNDATKNIRLFGPDETASNRLDAVYEVTGKAWMAERSDQDENLSPSGRVMEILSEHTCQGWLEGYILTGRHGLFNCYEAFVHIVDSMFNQHAKWLEVSRSLSWRAPIASFNYLLSSHVWRQDHNGFSHQDPGFIDLVMNKKAEVVRVYLPPDANCLVCVVDHCLQSRDYVNVVVAGKNPAPTWLSMDEAIEHCASGIGRWDFASNDDGCPPDVVLGCAGDAPTLETLAAVQLIRQYLPQLRVRVVNVVDVMRLQPQYAHPHGISDETFEALFTRDRPVIFAYHGYPTLIHRLIYKRACAHNFHVRGYIEEGTTTTPFDMVMLNNLDRFHLVMDVIDRVPGLAEEASDVRDRMIEERDAARTWTREHGEDKSEITNWSWPDT